MLSANYEAFCVVEKGIKSVFNLTNLIRFTANEEVTVLMKASLTNS